MTAADPLHPKGTLLGRIQDQAHARDQFLAALDRIADVERQALDAAQDTQTSWSDCRTRLIVGLTECLDLIDPLDPADAAVLRHRPTYAPQGKTETGRATLRRNLDDAINAALPRSGGTVHHRLVALRDALTAVDVIRRNNPSTREGKS